MDQRRHLSARHEGKACDGIAHPGNWNVSGRIVQQSTELEFGYTHAVLVDPNVEGRDGYRGKGAGTPAIGDYVAIPAGQTDNWWQVVFSFVAVIPGYNRQDAYYWWIEWERPGVGRDWYNVRIQGGERVDERKERVEKQRNTTILAFLMTML